MRKKRWTQSNRARSASSAPLDFAITTAIPVKVDPPAPAQKQAIIV